MLAATTVSIALTFGTSAIVDRAKANAEKREMVAMIMYDMRESISSVKSTEADLQAFYEAQVDVVAHPEKLAESYVELAMRIPVPDYTTTTETIFRSNIETIQTIGNILFIQSVSSFYDTRKQFMERVVDAFQNEAVEIVENYEALRDFDSPGFIFLTEAYRRNMQADLEQCMLMMKVTDKDLDVFSRQQQELADATKAKALEGIQESTTARQNRALQLQKAREEGEKSLKR